MDYKPLIDYSAKPVRKSYIVAAYRWLAVASVIAFVVGLYWRLS